MIEISAVITSLRNRARKLEEFAAELERLAVNENLTAHLPDNSQPGSKSVTSPQAVTPKVVIPAVELAKKEKKTRVITCRGLRANILRYLITGEAGAITVASAVDTPVYKVKVVLLNLVHEGFAIEDIRTVVRSGSKHEYRVYTLTDKGKEEAQWFVDNPDIMIRNKQSVSNAARRTRSATEARPN